MRSNCRDHFIFDHVYRSAPYKQLPDHLFLSGYNGSMPFAPDDLERKEVDKRIRYGYYTIYCVVYLDVYCNEAVLDRLGV